ncbi:hypothetical protein ACFQ21_12850 [Ohtaekwangia kribbensis]|uniref:Uncharacterized protein n=1 Tax=Ohtaekwangia kribbensis TaxID=688913 RepID=A0ABW3K1Q3_9BACT
MSSYPRLLLEVFIRKNFGERYFSFSKAILLSIILVIVPLLLSGGLFFFSRNSHLVTGTFLMFYVTWYIFVAAFLYFSIIRWKEVKRNPSVFDFEKFSLYTGDIDPRFYNFKIKGVTPTPRTVETIYEPAIFLIAGIVCFLFAQPIGLLLISCSILYHFSYKGAYRLGDEFVMDKMDEMILNEEMFDSFVEGKDSSETRGVRFYGRRPADENVRTKIVSSFTEEQIEAVEVH